MGQKFIVAEVSKNWTGNPNEVAEIISNKFEEVININLDRGYKLIDWKVSMIVNEGVLTETIIAIFEKIETTSL